jgi:hypothetical protein
MIQYHHDPAIDHVHAGVAMAIQVQRIPFSRRMLRIAALVAMTPHSIIHRKGIQSVRPGSYSYPLSSFLHGRNIRHSAGTTPVFADIPFLHLELMRPQPGAPIGAIRADGMIQQTAVLFLMFFSAPLQYSPPKHQLKMIVGIIFLR